MTLESLRQDLVGHRFPVGSFHAEGYENWLACDAVRSPQLNTGELHPAWILMGGLRGMGLSLTQLFHLLGASEDDGVMFGETVIELCEPLQIGRTYEVEGEIVDVVRRKGARLGPFDLVTFRLRLIGRAGHDVAASLNTFVVPRRSL